MSIGSTVYFSLPNASCSVRNLCGTVVEVGAEGSTVCISKAAAGDFENHVLLGDFGYLKVAAKALVTEKPARWGSLRAPPTSRGAISAWFQGEEHEAELLPDPLAASARRRAVRASWGQWLG